MKERPVYLTGRKKVLPLSMLLFALVFLGYALSRKTGHLFPVQFTEGMAWAALGAEEVSLSIAYSDPFPLFVLSNHEQSSEPLLL